MAGHALPNADVLVATWWETVEWANGLPASKGMKVHFVQDHEVFPYLPVTRVKAAYRLPMPKIAVSQWLYDLLHTEYGAKNVALVPNAVDSTFFNAPARTKQPVPTFGFLYSRSPRKGIAVCIDAIDEVKRKLPSLRVISFGADVFHHTVPLPDWVEFHKNPRQADLPSLYASCDAWLFPSISEGFGLPVLEAMACRTPVIGTSAGGGAEYINNATGALVKPTAGDFVEQMLAFAGMGEAEWKAKSSAARRRVASYRWEEATALFESFLKTVCADRTT
jgi:glycosyltransferase involved in cell wall biosynthesis